MQDRSSTASWKAGVVALTLASTAALVAFGGVAKADTLCVQNNAAFGNGPIVTVDCTTGAFVNSFIPDGAQIGSANGRGVEVLGNFVYYTELTGNGFGPTDLIRVAPFNGGAGGHDLALGFPNPIPGTGVVDLASDNMGHLYYMTGYPNGPEEVFETTGNGTLIGSPVTLTTLGGANLTDSDGFTILANGNWLINDGDAINSYNQYNPTTGAEIAGTNVIATTSGGACGSSTGVETDGTNLYFDCNFDSIAEDTMAGVFISSTSTLPDGTTGEDISLIEAAPINPPTVPEPASLSILGAGLAGLGWARRRKRSV